MPRAIRQYLHTVLLGKNGNALENSRIAFSGPELEALTAGIGIGSGLGIDHERGHLLYLIVPQSVLLLTNSSPREVAKEEGGAARERGNKYKHCLISIFFSKFKIAPRTLARIEHCSYFGVTNVKLHRSIPEGFRYENFLQV